MRLQPLAFILKWRIQRGLWPLLQAPTTPKILTKRSSLWPQFILLASNQKSKRLDIAQVGYLLRQKGSTEAHLEQRVSVIYNQTEDTFKVFLLPCKPRYLSTNGEACCNFAQLCHSFCSHFYLSMLFSSQHIQCESDQRCSFLQSCCQSPTAKKIFNAGSRQLWGKENVLKIFPFKVFQTCSIENYKEKAPVYSLSKRYNMPGDRNPKPGPGAYASEKVILSRYFLFSFL